MSNKRVLKHLSRGMRFPTMWYVLPAKAQTSLRIKTFEPRHEISNNVVCATSKGSDQPAHTRSLIRALAGRLNIL